MGRPRSNNLQVNLDWAFSTGAFKPQFSFLDSSTCLASHQNSEDNLKDCIDLTQQDEGHNVRNTGMPAVTAPSYAEHSFGKEDERHKVQAHAADLHHNLIMMSSESDSDLEFLASFSGARKPSDIDVRNATDSKDKDTTNNVGGVIDLGNPNAEAIKPGIIDTSSAPNTPPRISHNQGQDGPGIMNSNESPSTPIFRLTQAQTAAADMPKQELGPLFSEKIALLEQKVKILAGRLTLHRISVDTNEIDHKIREVDRRIETFEESDEIDDPFSLSSSPRMTDISTRLQYDINNDQFDSDINGDLPIITTRKLAVENRDDTHDNDDIEVLEYSESQNVSRLQTSPYFEIQEESSARKHYDDSVIIATESVLPPSSAQYASQEQKQPVSSQSTSLNPWTREMMHILRTRFGLHGFRPNQAEAVNETLSGNDVVVLMPTGGGKSLCYQLPALVTTGSTHGTTVVISPLISLMQDQVYHLKNRSIRAEMLNSRLSSSERSAVFASLRNNELQLLYISPEMLSASAAMQSALHKLYMDNQLARIVIDEAHCVSAWGHDFRPEYMELTKVKKEFPTTPIMALTATANERVLLDIVGCLRSNPIVLKQSFNRKNLYYEVRQKSGDIVSEIFNICRTYAGKSGIIYCHSKRSCEETATKLSRMGIKAEFYHAGMTQDKRYWVQETWQQGQCSVVCATIAFGMGIDKPDVRYVIHMTLPRNIEGYYQETGRAGRDGKLSQCILFYNYRDVQMMQTMIQQDTQLSHQVREHQRALLMRVMQYCENKTDCRRKQVLQYFNEDFDSRLCRLQCDNCRNMRNSDVVSRNMSEEAKLVIGIVDQIAAQHVTTQQVTDVLLGRRTQKSRTCGFDKMPWFGKMHSFGPLIAERLVHALISERVIEEYSKFNHSRFPQSYIRLGPRARLVESGQIPILLTMPRDSDLDSDPTRQGSKPSAVRAKRGTTKPAEFRKYKRARVH